MQRQIALSYAIAGLAVAIAVVTAFGATTGLLAPSAAPTAEVAVLEAAPPEPLDAQACAAGAEAPATAAQLQGRQGALLADARALPTGEDVEVVYVDEPAPSRRGHDDDSDEDSDRDSDEDRDERRDDDRSEDRDERRGHGHGERHERDDD
jgi:hypothetical protein